MEVHSSSNPPKPLTFEYEVEEWKSRKGTMNEPGKENEPVIWTVVKLRCTSNAHRPGITADLTVNGLTLTEAMDTLPLGATVTLTAVAADA